MEVTDIIDISRKTPNLHPKTKNLRYVKAVICYNRPIIILYYQYWIITLHGMAENIFCTSDKQVFSLIT